MIITTSFPHTNLPKSANTAIRIHESHEGFKKDNPDATEEIKFTRARAVVHAEAVES